MTTQVQTKNVTIPLGSNSTSTVVPYGYVLVAVETPVSFEGQSLTFKTTSANETGPGVDLYDGFVRYSEPCAASRYCKISNPEIFKGAKYIEIYSNIAGTPSNVAAARILNLIFASES